VDDNRDGADTLAMMLKLMGHETRTAHDGLGAVEAAEAFRPDVVLLDNAGRMTSITSRSGCVTSTARSRRRSPAV
jgi:CheY-like chemotaxis protein